MRFPILVFALFLAQAVAAAIILENTDYTVRVDASGSIQITERTTGTVASFEPDFLVLMAERDPQLRLRPLSLPVNYNVPTWMVNEQGGEAALFRAKRRSAALHGDGFDDRILEGEDGVDRTANVFAAGRQIRMRPFETLSEDVGVTFRFEDNESFGFMARLELGLDGPPALTFTITPKVEAYYSVGYTGAPRMEVGAVEEIWQPLIWTERRFPDQPYLTLAFRCPLPTTLVEGGGITIGVMADSSEFPFEPLPTLERSRFGVAVRSETGFAQPSFFAPVLGGIGSKLPVGEAFRFKMRLLVEPASLVESYERIARRDFRFHDYRDNALGSLNLVMERMISYAMSDFANFMAELKGCSYSTDVPDAVKNVSSLNPLNMALLRDDTRIFEERAYPIMEFMLSREKFLFALDREQKIQSPSRKMAGPAAPLSELTSLYAIGQGANPFLLRLAEELSGKDRILNLDTVVRGGNWQGYLSLYKATGDRAQLEKARAGADDYIRERDEHPKTGFDDKPFFWTAFVQDFPRLTELYEETGERRYLEAARDAARRFCFHVWMSPAIPEHPVLVNEGNKAPVYWYLKRYREDPLDVPAEWVPAWRLSEIGLTPESTGTSSGHRAILMANFAPWLLRIGYYANDTFLHDIARSAVVGRYRNFPGYHINTDRTTIYEGADYPLREHRELNVNSFHYNHIWPQISFIFDFMVTDALVKSKGAIDFPGTFIEGYAYLQNRFYGHRPGRFHHYDDAILWMPKDLFRSSSGQLNGISARGQGRAYFAFTNQSDETVRSEIELNRSLLKAGAGPLPVESWIGNEAATCGPLEGDTMTVEVPPSGVVSFAIGGVDPQALFQESILQLSETEAWKTDFVGSPFGGLRAMVMNWGPERLRAYIYLQADDSLYSEATLILADGRELEDATYPYEFTVSLPSGTSEFSFRLRTTTVEGEIEESQTFMLRQEK